MSFDVPFLQAIMVQQKRDPIDLVTMDYDSTTQYWIMKLSICFFLYSCLVQVYLEYGQGAEVLLRYV